MAGPYVLPGRGTILQISIASTFTTVGNRVEIDGPDGELEVRDTSHLDSDKRSFRPDIPNLGKLSGTVYFDPSDTVHIACRAKTLTAPSAPDSFKLIYNDGLGTPAEDAFSGFITKWQPTGMKIGESLQAKFEIVLTDSFTATAGTA